MKLAKIGAQRGFTILEIMLVMAIMGVILGLTSFSFDVSSNKERVNKEARRFVAVFQAASDFALLNNFELGLQVKENTYRFLAFNHESYLWSELSDEELLEEYELPEDFTLQLALGDIPWLDDQRSLEDGLFSQESLLGEDSLFELGEEKEIEKRKKMRPQVYLFSSGEITPFTLTFLFEEAFSDEEPIAFEVTGEFTLPLKVEGPVRL